MRQTINKLVKQFQVSVGEIDYFKGICEDLSLSKEQETIIRGYISNKNFFAVKEYLQSEQISEEQIRTIMAIEDLFGSVDMLEEAGKLSSHPLVQGAIERLKSLYEVLCAYQVEKYVSFDLGMLSSYQYYTGIIFKVYTLGIGDVVVKGGRYDKLLPYFGKNSPAIGFVIVIDDLMQALKRQKIEIAADENHLLIVYDGFGFAESLKEAKVHRDKGVNVQLMRWEASKSKEDYEMYAKNHGIHQVIYLIK